MLKRIALITAVAILGVTGTAVADPIVLPGDTPLYIKFDNVEQVSTLGLAGGDILVPGGAHGTADNWGVFSVTTIDLGNVVDPNVNIGPTGSPAEYYNGTQGSIYGIFYDIILTSTTTAIGGKLDLWWSDAVGAVNLATANDDAATVAAFTSGTFLAQLLFEPGINANIGDCTTTIDSDSDPTTVGGSGRADSFASVNLAAGGAWASVLDGNWFITGCGVHDVRFSNFFTQDRLDWNGPDLNGDGIPDQLGLNSSDPARVFTNPIPEPATLTLLGLGLAGLGYRRRRRA